MPTGCLLALAMQDTGEGVKALWKHKANIHPEVRRLDRSAGKILDNSPKPTHCSWDLTPSDLEGPWIVLMTTRPRNLQIAAAFGDHGRRAHGRPGGGD